MKLSTLIKRISAALDAAPWADVEIDVSDHSASVAASGMGAATTIQDCLDRVRAGFRPVSGEPGLAPGGAERWAWAQGKYPNVDARLLEILSYVEDPALALHVPGQGGNLMAVYAGTYDAPVTAESWLADAQAAVASGRGPSL